jgi:site-specific recombinase XerD
VSDQRHAQTDAAESGAVVGVYLGSLGAGSRRTLRQSLDRIAFLLTGGTDPAIDAGAFAWPTLTGARLRALRTQLVEHYAPATVNKMLAAVRGLMRTCRDRGLIDEARYQQIAQVKPMADWTRTLSRTLTDAEVAALYRAAGDDRSAAGRRDAALLTILLTGGLRSEEVTELNVGDVDLDGRTFHVRSALAERDRVVPMDLPGPDRRAAPGAAALRDWLELRRVTGDDDAGAERQPFLLGVDKGGTIRLGRLTGTALLGILGRLSQRAGIAAASTRDLRRSCIVRLIAAGHSLDLVRTRVGHLSWLTEKAYQELAGDLRQLGPVHLGLPYVQRATTSTPRSVKRST